jgi:hypothetical protein
VGLKDAEVCVWLSESGREEGVGGGFAVGDGWGLLSGLCQGWMVCLVWVVAYTGICVRAGVSCVLLDF